MAGNEILTFDKQPSLGLLTSALQVYLCPIWIDAETAEERIFSLKEFHTFCFGLSFITGNRLFHSLLSPATCHPASRTCKLDANYRGELNAPVGLVSHPPTLSIFNSFFSVYAVFCGSLWCVDIYKSVCQRYMLALVCFSPMVPEIFFIHSIQLAQQPNKN